MTTPSPEAVATFMRITGASEFVAVQKLEEYGGNLNEAVNAHFIEGNSHIQEQNLAATATPHYNYSEANNQSNQNRAGSRGILPFFNAARRFRPSLLLDSNYRRELRDLCNGLGSTTLSSSTPPHGSPQGEGREFPTGNDSALVSPYRPGLSYAGAVNNGNLSSHGQGYYGTNDYQNNYPLAQSNSPRIRDLDVEDAMIQAAIEASKEESTERSSWNAPNDFSDDELPQSIFHQEDDDLAHVISLSLQTAEQEEALRELQVKEEKKVLGTHALLAKGEKTNTSRSRLEPGPSSSRNVASDVAQPVINNPLNHNAGGHHQVHGDPFIAEKWGGISSDELNEALLIETALFSEIPNHNSHKSSSLPGLQHHSGKNVDPKMQSSSSSASQLLTQLLRQQQDADYLASLLVDKQKELNSLKKAETNSSKKEESHEKMPKRAELEKKLDTKKIMLPNEPPLGDENAITIVVRMPDGGRCERRFFKTDKLQQISFYAPLPTPIKFNIVLKCMINLPFDPLVTWFKTVITAATERLLFDFIDISGAVEPGTYRVWWHNLLSSVLFHT
ncbi:UBX domain-containing protein [Trifolium pratense]|uniref:UBX domain-containing protein n=2 Tax=Trifolium TaxID=3898 RepID=A0A2K3P278_TRIPR|nr:UBX domain-containing protein [Trifolium pratense]